MNPQTLYGKDIFEPANEGDALERCRRKAVEPFYPHAGGFGTLNLGDARKAIRAYRKTTGDAAGTLDLLLTHLEAGMRFSLEFGDVDQRFHQGLIAALNDIVKILRTPEGGELYSRAQSRLQVIANQFSGPDCELSQAVKSVVARLDAAFSGYG